MNEYQVNMEVQDLTVILKNVPKETSEREVFDALVKKNTIVP
jgi:hypothetical protein